MKNITLFYVFIILNFATIAHPVAFQGSKGLMGFHSNLLSHNQINYSLKHWLAFGVHHIRLVNDQTKNATLTSVNFLVKRWNAEGLQANVYTILGIGVNQFHDKDNLTALSALQFDIENRDYYFLVKYLNLFQEKTQELIQTTWRAGFSPYIDNFEGFHSWFILEWQSTYIDSRNQRDDLTPYLRFFYRNLLFEIGQSFNGHTKFNYIMHF